MSLRNRPNYLAALENLDTLLRDPFTYKAELRVLTDADHPMLHLTLKHDGKSVITLERDNLNILILAAGDAAKQIINQDR